MSKTSLSSKDEEEVPLTGHECGKPSSSQDLAHRDIGRSASLARPLPAVSFKEALHHERQQMQRQAPSPPTVASESRLFESLLRSTSRRSNRSQRSRHHWSTSWMVQMSGIIVTLVVLGVISLTFRLHEPYTDTQLEKRYEPGLEVVKHDSANPGNKSTVASARSHRKAQQPAETDRSDASSKTENASCTRKEIHSPITAAQLEVKATKQQGFGSPYWSSVGSKMTRKQALQSSSLQPDDKTPEAATKSVKVLKFSSPESSGKGTKTARNPRSLVRLNRTAWIKTRDLQLLLNG